jgi:hypothetical protein
MLKSSVNDNKTTYKINVVVPNYKYDEWPTLDNLKVMNYDMLENFSEYTNTYHVNIPDSEDSVLIDYESDYDVEIIGNEDLKIGENIITIVVSNGEYENKYYLIVQKQEKEVIEERSLVKKSDKKDDTNNLNNKSDAVQNITIGLILFTTLIMITVFILRDKEEKNN